MTSIREAQKSYESQYDKRAIRDWVFVRFLKEETGKRRKLSRPWYGPFRIVVGQDPNSSVSMVYFPGDRVLTVHQRLQDFIGMEPNGEDQDMFHVGCSMLNTVNPEDA